MEQAIAILQTAFAKTFGAALGAAIVYGGLFLLVVLLAAPVYFLLKRRVPGRIDLRWGEAPTDALRFHDSLPATGEAPGAGELSPDPGAGGGGDSRRAEFLQRLDSVDRVVTTVYEYMIYFAIAAMTGLAAFLYLVLPDDSSRDFLIFYGGVLYLLGMLWATSQLYAARRRRAGEPARSIRSALSQLGSKINISVETEPQVFSLDDAALERAAQHLAGGGTLDEACALVVPQYAGMNGIMKGILRKAVEAALEARRQANG